MGKRVIVTGGAGFIGSNIANQCNGLGDDVIVLDNFSTGRAANIDENITLVEIDLSDASCTEIVNDIVSDCDLVYHMAGSVGVKYIDEQPRETLRNTFNINNNLFPVFERHNSRVIFASTSEVYGDTDEAHESDVLKIGSPDKLRWGYACSKLMSEFLLKSYTFPSTIVRFFNVTGRGQLDNYGMVLPSFVKAAKRNKDLVIYGDGSQYRSFCDIRDACHMLNVVSQPKHIDQIYNIGNSNNTITILNLAKLVIETIGCDSNIKFTRYSDSFSDQFEEIFKRKPNTNKINQFYTPRYNTVDIIKSMMI